MAKSSKIVAAGNSAGVILPNQFPARLNDAPGETAPNAANLRVIEATTAAEAIMHEDRDILAELSK
jgi:hypothetical protein